MIGTTADNLAGWRYQPAATPVDKTGGIASGAIHPDNPGGVLHRPLTQEALPILVARLGPVGDVEGRVVGPRRKPHRCGSTPGNAGRSR